METILISIDYRDPAWIAVAFLFGLVMRRVNLPPMVGFLLAGFVLHLLGTENDEFLLAVADMGVTLLLFTIGLKLRINTLVRPEIWATTGLHMLITIVLSTATVMVLGWAGMLLFNDLDFTAAVIVAFALSFSSTVFAVKILEDRGMLVSRYGQVAIGVLVMQDIAAVAFLAVSMNKVPSPWALALVGLIPARHLLGYLMQESGHKELLIVFGFVMALGGAALFEMVGMKGDLGALVVGALLAHHERARRLARILLSFKDVFLVCFFLTIGLTGLPTWETATAAMVLVLFIPVKTALFGYLLIRFRLRAHSATYGSLTLSNYSEFGLIVTAVAIKAGWLTSDWLTVLALAVTASFLISAFINNHANDIFTRFGDTLMSWEDPVPLPGDNSINLGGHRILVFGMGRVGRAAYDEMNNNGHNRIIGIDIDEQQVANCIEEGRNVVLGDATSPEFWSRLISHDDIEMILVAMPHHNANLNAAKQMRERGYTGPIVATALYPNQEDELRENGIDEVFNVYAEAGGGAAIKMSSFLGRDETHT